jgi:hypothetical protein
LTRNEIDGITIVQLVQLQNNPKRGLSNLPLPLQTRLRTPERHFFRLFSAVQSSSIQFNSAQFSSMHQCTFTVVCIRHSPGGIFEYPRNKENRTKQNRTKQNKTKQNRTKTKTKTKQKQKLNILNFILKNFTLSRHWYYVSQSQCSFFTQPSCTSHPRPTRSTRPRPCPTSHVPRPLVTLAPPPRPAPPRSRFPIPSPFPGPGPGGMNRRVERSIEVRPSPSTEPERSRKKARGAASGNGSSGCYAPNSLYSLQNRCTVRAWVGSWSIFFGSTSGCGHWVANECTAGISRCVVWDGWGGLHMERRNTMNRAGGNGENGESSLCGQRGIMQRLKRACVPLR